MGKVPFEERWDFKEVRLELCVKKTTRAESQGRGERRRQGWVVGDVGILFLDQKNCQVGSKHMVGMVES